MARKHYVLASRKTDKKADVNKASWRRRNKRIAERAFRRTVRSHIREFE